MIDLVRSEVFAHLLSAFAIESAIRRELRKLRRAHFANMIFPDHLRGLVRERMVSHEQIADVATGTEQQDLLAARMTVQPRSDVVHLIADVNPGARLCTHGNRTQSNHAQRVNRVSTVRRRHYFSTRPMLAWRAGASMHRGSRVADCES